MEQVRSFIAIELPDEIRVVLHRLEAELKSGGHAPVKWVDPDSIHLTLKFLGSIAVDRISEITRAIEGACRGISPFKLEVRGLGVFPNLRRVQVVWVGIMGEVERLCQLQQHIESNLVPLGFAPESRPFTPHLTLARVRDQASPDERQSLGQLITSTRFEEVYGFSVHSINLMKSQLTSVGAVYSLINSVKLSGQ